MDEHQDNISIPRAKFNELYDGDKAWRAAKEEYHEELVQKDARIQELENDLRLKRAENAHLQSENKRWKDDVARTEQVIGEIEKELTTARHGSEKKDKLLTDKTLENKKLVEDISDCLERNDDLKADNKRLDAANILLKEVIQATDENSKAILDEFDILRSCKERLEKIEEILQEQLCRRRRGSTSSNGSVGSLTIMQMDPHRITVLLLEAINGANQFRDASPDSYGKAGSLKSKKSRLGMGNRTVSLQDEFRMIGEHGDDDEIDSESISSFTDTTFNPDSRRPSILSPYDNEALTSQTPRKQSSISQFPRLTMSESKTITSIPPISPTFILPPPNLSFSLPKIIATFEPSSHAADHLSTTFYTSISSNPTDLLSPHSPSPSSKSHIPLLSSHKPESSMRKRKRSFLPAHFLAPTVLLSTIMTLFVVMIAYLRAAIDERKMWLSANDITRQAVVVYNSAKGHGGVYYSHHHHHHYNNNMANM